MKSWQIGKIVSLLLLVVFVVIGVAGNAYAQTENELGEFVPGNLPPSVITPEPTPTPAKPALNINILNDIKKRKVLNVVMLGNDNLPFFGEDDKGNLIGVDVDIAKEVADSLDVKVNFIRSAKTFDEVVEGIYKGEGDIAISKLARSLPRAQKVHYSKPYLNFRQALLINRLLLAQEEAEGRNIDTILIRDRQNFKKTIGVLDGTVYIKYAENIFPKATIKRFPTWEKAVEAVVNGTVFALFRDELEVRGIALSSPDLSIKLRTVVLAETNDTRAMATSIENTPLADYVDLYLDIQYKSQGVNDLLQRYKKTKQSAK
jgi:polar amino acid transport system substrate-binding protein